MRRNAHSDGDLSRQGVLVRDALIGGARVSGSGRFSSLNPSTGEVLAEVADCGAAETFAAIEAASGSFGSWSGLLASERCAILRRWGDLILSRSEELARLTTLEAGKPLRESRAEVAYAASFVSFYAEEGTRVYGETIPSHRSDARIVVFRQPIGVSAAITPWNFPLAMLTRKIAPALAVGCPTIVKPSEESPLCALALSALAEEAGFPDGVVNVLTAKDPRPIGETLSASESVRALSFTGSSEVGRLLAAQCARTVKKVSLELGGNAPFVIFDDADLDAAVDGVMASKFRNAGQTCVCANRIFAQSGIYDRFVESLASRASSLKVADGMDEDSDIGPLINSSALAKTERHVADALSKGGRVVVGGSVSEAGGLFYSPTVIADADVSMALSEEETFGPVAAVFRFDSEAEAIASANATSYGLSGYFYSRNHARCWRVAEALECGIVGVNEGVISTAIAPFGGMKASGLGREGSRHGLDEYLEIKYVLMGGLS